MSTTSHTNRLSNETSPYLLQHQHNPVDWYPWGDEAFAAARSQGKPIFLSVGYSTCYWCHVMERQCFESETIAAVMNEKFINIKVDREERPDVDQLYMTAVQVLTQHGGWPMSVWLTPDRKPFYGGTYFPPEDMQGRPGFPTLLNALSEAWTNRRDDINKSADQLVSILQQLAQPTPSDRDFTIDEKYIDALIDRSTSDYEPIHGGFGHAPKFPRETLLELLLTHHAKHPNEERAKMIRHTLDAMANGGIRDHLGGGFHRYSTDAKWLVPHFEIMLYDNAMLGWCYVEAFRQFNEPRYATVARGVFDFVLRDLTSPSGAFFTALDAEVDGKEGLNYLWTRDEVESIVKEHGDPSTFLRMYGLHSGPNFADPHHGNGVPDANILFLPDGPARESDPSIMAMRQALLSERGKRKQPRLDDKILISWNALMIRALAFGGKTLDEPRYIDAAITAARAVLHLRADRKGTLDDDAFLAHALLELHRVTDDASWRHKADAIASTMRERFEDTAAGGFFLASSDTSDLIVRQKSATDSPLPSGNAIAASVFLQLDQPDVARRTIEAFAGQIEQNGESMSALVNVAHAFVERHGPIDVKAASNVAKLDRPMSPQELAASVVTLRGTWVDPSTLRLNVLITKPFHIHAHEASEPYINTRLEVTRDGEPIDAMIEYPPGQSRRFAFADDDLPIYEGRVPITVHFGRPQSGLGVLQCALSYQACDENACLPPVAQQFEVPSPG